MSDHKPAHVHFAFFSLVLFVVIGYVIERHQTTPLFICYLALFILYALLLRRQEKIGDRELSYWIFASLLSRAVLLFSTPHLSNDFYRFVWDGRVFAAGHNPFSEIPSYYLIPRNSVPGLDFGLYDKLNSKHTFSTHLPICQFVYWISVKLAPDSVHSSVLIMKNILFVLEIGTLWIIKRLLSHFAMPAPAILIYALNPLVILEITGNVHFEGIMIFFLLTSIYLLCRGRFLFSSAAFALSVCTKLIPLLFLPIFVHMLGWKRALLYIVIAGGIVFLLFLPFADTQLMDTLSTGIGYYFEKFEFNASVYYMIRSAMDTILEPGTFAFIAPGLASIAFLTILYLSLHTFRSRLSGNIPVGTFEVMLWCLCVFYLSTTVLHPWHVIPLLALSVFTPYRFPAVWTGLIFMTYIGYTRTSFTENFVVVTLEYILVIAYLLYEMKWKRPAYDV